MSRQDSRGKIEKLVTYFGENIYQLKSSASSEPTEHQITAMDKEIYLTELKYE